MKDMKNYFPLFGNKSQDFNWIMKDEDLHFQGLDVRPKDWITCSSMPSLYLDQIPARFLNTFPGFYILCRETVPSHYPFWVLSPWSKDYLEQKRGYYQLRQNKLIDPKRAKVFNGLINQDEFSKLAEVYAGTSHYVFNEDETILLHSLNHLSLYQDIFNRPYFFFDIIDFNFKGFSYLHFTCLARGGVIQNNQLLLTSSPSRILKRWYGNWELYLLKDQSHD